MEKIYGIDLGTTNSLLGYRDQLLTDLVPSVVDMRTGVAGYAVKESQSPSIVRSFKCNMSMGKEGQLARAASARVLRQLVEESGEDVKKVVISVPADFSDEQRQATCEAAKVAGLEVAGLINEPTAAAIYISGNRHALSVVYDLGGGTFDISVVDSRFGDYDVQATDGCILGGDDLDRAICRWAIQEAGIKRHHCTPEILQQLQWECSQLKLRIQRSRQMEVLDISHLGLPATGSLILFPETYVQLMKQTFADTIWRTQKVLGEAIPSCEEYDLILVGGSTRCPFLREWISAELGVQPVALTYDPDRIVAQGAALYAGMIMDGSAAEKVSDVTQALSIEVADGSCRVIIPRNSKIPIEETVLVSNAVQADHLQLNLVQGSSLMAKRNDFIGELAYHYGEVKEAGQGEVFVTVQVNADGLIHFSCKELLKPEVTVTLRRAC